MDSIELVRECRGGSVVSLVAAVIVAAALAGCNKPPFDVAPAQGRVTLDGQPLTGAKVMFAPVAARDSVQSGKPAFGLLQPDGRFVLSTYAPDDGAVVGEHWVTVIRMPAERSGTRRPDAGDASNEKEDPATWDRVIFPQRLTVAPDGANDFTIALTSEIVAQHGRADH